MRAAMWGLLALVAASAAVLSFAALRDLALVCGFHDRLSFLLPLVVDAGAAAGCMVWLSPRDVTRQARGFARTLTWVLLASSVAGNAIVHGLAAYHRLPHWTLVVAVSGVAPAVLGAVVHLAVLVGRSEPEPVSVPETPDRTSHHERVTSPGPRGMDVPRAPRKPARATTPREPAELVAATRKLLPIGRRKLAASLGVSEHTARELLREASTTRMRVMEVAR